LAVFREAGLFKAQSEIKNFQLKQSLAALATPNLGV